MASRKMSADERKIRETVDQWEKDANKLDVKAVLANYLPDATLVWEGFPAAYRTAAIRRYLKTMFGFPGMKLGFTPVRITIAPGGKMATEFGRFSFAYDDAKTGKRESSVSKYLVVWRKVGGKWKVFFDCYNSNAPH